MVEDLFRKKNKFVLKKVLLVGCQWLILFSRWLICFVRKLLVVDKPNEHGDRSILYLRCENPLYLFLELHSTTQTLTTRTHTHPYWLHVCKSYPYEHLRRMSTSKSGDSRSHHWHLVVDGNVTYHLTHNADKSWKIQNKVRAPRLEPWWVTSTGPSYHCTTSPFAL
jgi:hypothetical protein